MDRVLNRISGNVGFNPNSAMAFPRDIIATYKTKWNYPSIPGLINLSKTNIAKIVLIKLYAISSFISMENILNNLPRTTKLIDIHFQKKTHSIPLENHDIGLYTFPGCFSQLWEKSWAS